MRSPSFEGDKECLENKAGGGDGSVNPEFRAWLTPEKLREMASDDAVLYLDALEDWRAAIPFILRERGINVSAWLDACDVMGEDIAFLALLVIDRNRYHPTAPIQNPGGAMRAFTQRAKDGKLNLALAILSIIERGRQGRQPKGDTGERRPV